MLVWVPLERASGQTVNVLILVPEEHSMDVCLSCFCSTNANEIIGYKVHFNKLLNVILKSGYIYPKPTTKVSLGDSKPKPTEETIRTHYMLLNKLS